ncbi:hypothetical protein B0H14DRAFT_2638747 [Mycena olivaceomarginata]|nr:hypothetical protein B0H14DRAFT_2638747 [Mycena olivaceomarginata]
MTPAPSRLMPPMPSTPCPNQVGDMRWLMRLILGSGSPGYPRISPITGRYVGASGDMSHSSHLLLTAMSPNDSCPFTNPGPLDAYYEAAAAFDRDFGHKYEATDEYEDCLSTKRKLWDIYKKILDPP